ncbi:hypothetical protein ABIE89_006487 [Bradyrhizobium niftali]|uniref:hypothetical protein n=1 Tax=Bradyrhizobium niftali TaxID=2560055 RepID=UPI00383997AC
MTIVFNLATLSPNDVESVEAINAGLSRLRERRVQRIERAGRLLKSKLAWKVQVYREVMLYRIVALTESAAVNWNSVNLLGAYLPARALIETSAVLLEFEHDLKQHLAAGDLAALDALLTNRTFATRQKDWIDQYPNSQAVNVLTVIDRMDKRLAKGIRGHYDRMSETCHPNYLGHHQLFGSLDTTTGLTTFSETKNLNHHRDVVIGALLLLLLDERCIERLGDDIDRIVEIQRIN